MEGGGVLERKNRLVDENAHLDDLFLIQLDYVNNLIHTWVLVLLRRYCPVAVFLVYITV